MFTLSSKLIVTISITTFLFNSIFTEVCSDYESLIPDYKCVENPKNFITGIVNPSFIVTKGDDSKEFLLVVVNNLEEGEIYKSNLEASKNDEESLCLEFSNKDKEKMVMILTIPKNLNIYTKLIDKSSFQNHREIVVLARKILQYLNDESDYILMKDINTRNIFLDEDNNPKFLFLSSSKTSEEKSTIKEKVYALGILIYTITQKNEPYSERLTKLNLQIIHQKLKINEKTSMDIINLITECVNFSDSETSYENLLKKFMEICENPNLDEISEDKDLNPSTGLLSTSMGIVNPISLSMLYVYGVALLIGSILFCVLRKPLEEHQRMQPVNPMMNGLDQAERNLQAMQGNQNVQDPLVGA